MVRNRDLGVCTLLLLLPLSMVQFALFDVFHRPSVKDIKARSPVQELRREEPGVGRGVRLNATISSLGAFSQDKHLADTTHNLRKQEQLRGSIPQAKGSSGPQGTRSRPRASPLARPSRRPPLLSIWSSPNPSFNRHGGQAVHNQKTRAKTKSSRKRGTQNFKFKKAQRKFKMFVPL